MSSECDKGSVGILFHKIRYAIAERPTTGISGLETRLPVLQINHSVDSKPVGGTERDVCGSRMLFVIVGHKVSRL